MRQGERHPDAFYRTTERAAAWQVTQVRNCITRQLCIEWAEMSATLPMITPRTKQPAGGCCAAPVQPDLDGPAAADLARVVKALADPVRLRIVDLVRKAAPEAVCQCEITPLFGISQPAVSRHLKLLVEAGVLEVERRGLWAHYYVPESSTLEVLDAWLT